MPSKAGLLNDAGGVRYHARALKYSERLWGAFRWPIGDWLLRWEPPETTLVLVGPSAGYNLQPFVLERFQRVIVLEPDPLARWLLSWRLRRVPLDPRPELRFVSPDHLVYHPERLGPLLAELGDAAILFCNVLGQVRHLLGTDDLDGKEMNAVRAAVHGATQGRSWASFHDRVSGKIAPALEDPILSERRWSDAELLEAAYFAGGDALQAALLDHGTHGFFPEHLPHLYLRWELEPGNFHVIEAVSDVRGAEPKA